MDLSRIKLFVFDFDGTLVQSNAIKRSTFYDVSVDITGASEALDELFRTASHLDRHGVFRALAERLGGLDADGLAEAYTALCEARIAAAPEVPGAGRLLARLRDKGRRAVVNSSTPLAALRRCVPRCAFGSFVDAIYGEPPGKLDNLRAAMGASGAAPEDTVVIGDGEGDRGSAAEAGCAFIAVASDDNNFVEPPRLIVQRLDPLIDWL